MSAWLRVALSAAILLIIASAWLLLLGFLTWGGWESLVVLALLLPTVGVPAAILINAVSELRAERAAKSEL